MSENTKIREETCENQTWGKNAIKAAGESFLWKANHLPPSLARACKQGWQPRENGQKMNNGKICL